MSALLLTQILGKVIQLRFVSSSPSTLLFNSESYSGLKHRGSPKMNTIETTACTL